MMVTLMFAAVLAMPVRGDFDHDGKLDIAELRAAPSGKTRLVIRRGGGPTSTVVQTFPNDWAARLYLDKAKPGIWKTWCGKGGGDDKTPCSRATVRLSGDTLGFGVEESSYSVVIWNGRRFEVVVLSD